MKVFLLISATLVLVVLAGLWYVRQKLTADHVMIAYAKDAVDIAKQKFHADLDYSEESIRRVEELVGQLHQEYLKDSKPTDDQLEMSCKVWGAYIGEVMRKHHGGEWSTSEDGVFQGQYVLTVNGKETSPLAKVYKRIVDGEEDNLHFYYQMTIRMFKGELK